MLKSEQRSHMIREYLARFTAYVHLSNGESKNDINHDAEAFYCGLLNIVLSENAYWGYQDKTVNLVDMNAIRQNYPAIDLGDPGNRLAVQVSSTEDREKVRSTLVKFFDHGLDAEFDRLIMLIIGSRDSYIRKFDMKPGFDFQIERDIWDTKRLGKEIGRLPDQRQQMVLEYLQEQFEDRSISNVSLYLPPSSSLNKSSFVGRHAELSEIQRRIDDGDKLIVLSGLGGMGKTELAIRFGRDYIYGSVYFTRFDTSFTHTLARMASGIRPMPSKETLAGSDERLCARVLSILEKCGRNDILIIDNMDVKQGGLGDLIQDSAYQALRKLDCRLIITTRLNHNRAIKVRPMPENDLLNIFRNHYVPLAEHQIKALINAVNGHTLTIDLIARTLNGQGWRKITPEMILYDLKNNSLSNASYQQISTDYNQSEDQVQIYQHLSVVFDANHIPDTHKKILCYATLLPSNGIDGDYFHGALAEEEQPALEELIDHGWLTAEDGSLTIHPVIRLVCQKELKPSSKTCGEFLNTLWEQFEPTYREWDTIAQIAELFANATEVTVNPKEKAEWLIHSCQLWGELKQYQQALILYEKHIPDLEQHLAYQTTLGTIYREIAFLYSCMGDHAKAIEFQQKALTAETPNHPQEYGTGDEHEEPTVFYVNNGKPYSTLGDYEQELEYTLENLKFCKDTFPPDHPELATSYNNVGTTYSKIGNIEKALEYLNKALKIRKDVLPPDHPLLAQSYNNVGIAHLGLDDPLMALECLSEALAISEATLPPDHPDLAAVYTATGRTYAALGDFLQALQYHQKALDINKKCLAPDHPDLAISYNNVSNVYRNLGEYRKALEYLTKSIPISEKNFPPDHIDLACSYNNAGLCLCYLGNYDKALQYQLKALAICEKVMPAEQQYLATTCVNIAVTYSQKGKVTDALSYAKRALAIYENTLPAGHSDIKELRSAIQRLKRQMYPSIIKSFLSRFTK